MRAVEPEASATAQTTSAPARHRSLPMVPSQPYGDLVQLNSQRTILDAIGGEILTEVAASYIELLETSAAIYEANGDYALGIFASGWCRMMDRASRELCRTPDNAEALASGRWHCHESCWKEAARPAIERGEAVDIACKGGIRLYAIPIRVGDEVVGAVNFGYGAPPRDEETQRALAQKYELPAEMLREAADAYQERTPEIIEIAKKRLHTSARLFGEMILRKRAEERAREADRLKDEFLALLGHELRNPLAPIVTAVAMLRMKGGAGERELGIIERQVAHLVGLVDDLLDVSRITQGKVALRQQELDIASLVGRALEMASPLLEQRAHELTVSVPAATLWVYGDARRLAQVFSNLLTNAAKYTPCGGHIEVSAAQQGDEVVVTVKDNGIGIGPELLPRIFEPFMQGERRLDRSEGGLGLGLTIARTMVQLHGGRILARSRPGERGSEFEVRLPASAHVTAALPAPASRAAPEVYAEPPRRARRILIVEDNDDAAEILAELLRQFGYQVAVAPDGPSALTLVSAFRPEIALVDIGLPVMDGYELARRLRAAPETAHLHLIAVTGYGQEKDRRRALSAGFDEHLAKPLQPEALLSLVQRVGG